MYVNVVHVFLKKEIVLGFCFNACFSDPGLGTPTGALPSLPFDHSRCEKVEAGASVVQSKAHREQKGRTIYDKMLEVERATNLNGQFSPLHIDSPARAADSDNLPRFGRRTLAVRPAT